MKKQLYLILFIACFMTQQLSAQTEKGVDLEKTGQSTMAFLQVGLVPEAVALGEAYNAVGKGVQSVFYNPAGLAEMPMTFEAFVSNVQWIADIQYLAGAVAWNFDNIGVFGLSFLSVDYGDIIGTRLLAIDAAATNPLGYEETGMVDNVGAYAFGLTYAKSITNMFSVGIGARLATHQLGRNLLNGSVKDNEQSKVIFDLGVRYYTPIEGFRFAMSIRNFSTSVKYEEISTQLPFTFGIGVAMDLMGYISKDLQESNDLLVSAEFSHPNNYTERLHFGVEYTFMKMFSLRSGYKTNHDSEGLSLGVGIKTELMDTQTSINYSYSQIDKYFDDVNRFSVNFSF